MILHDDDHDFFTMTITPIKKDIDVYYNFHNKRIDNETPYELNNKR